jgi:hypothetical protein
MAETARYSRGTSIAQLMGFVRLLRRGIEMTRGRFLIRTCTACVLGLLLTAAPARADLISIFFEGEIDLTSDGGQLYEYSGFFTWDTTEPVENIEDGIFTYALNDFQLTFGGVDVTQPPSPQTIGNGLSVINDLDPFGTGVVDALGFYALVGRPYDPTGDLHLVAVLAGPETMFSSSALPNNLDFLAAVNDQFVFMFFEPDELTLLSSSSSLEEIRGTLEITDTRIVPVPEPAMLTLTALGLAGAFARFRRRT